MWIIQKVKSWLGLKTIDEARQYNLFDLGDRQIYHYHNGKEEIHADPMILYKAMMKVGPELSIDMKVATSASKDAEKAHDSLIKKIRGIFSLKSLEEGGLTENESIDLLDHFLIYTEVLKKNSSPLVTSPMVTSHPSSPSSAEKPTTLSSSECGSTDKEPSTAGPMPSASVPV